MLPFSKEIPKEMFPIIVCNGDNSPELKPVIQAIFEQLHAAGVRSFYIVVGRGKRALEDHFSPDSRFLDFLRRQGKLPKSLLDFYAKIGSSSLAFLNQPEPLGFGHAVELGRQVMKGPFLVQAADTFILSENDGYLDRLAAMHRKYRASATILLEEVPDPRRYGVVDGYSLEEGVMRITSAVEKPETPPTNHAIMPIYLFTEEIFDALSGVRPGYGGEIQLTDAIRRLIAGEGPVIGVALEPDEHRLDLGSMDTMRKALRIALDYVDMKTSEVPEISTSWVMSSAGSRESVPGTLPTDRTRETRPISIPLLGEEAKGEGSR